MNDDQEQFDREEIPPSTQEQALEQRIVPFMGDELAAALTANGGIFISLPGMCNALGLNARGQLQRIQRTKELSLVPFQRTFSGKGKAWGHPKPRQGGFAPRTPIS